MAKHCNWVVQVITALGLLLCFAPASYAYRGLDNLPLSSKAKSGGNKSVGSKTAKSVKRDKNGKIARSAKARDDFKKAHPCPATGKSHGPCDGYVVDHVKPLKKGGPMRRQICNGKPSGTARRKTGQNDSRCLAEARPIGLPAAPAGLRC